VKGPNGRGINTGCDIEMFSEADARLIAVSPSYFEAVEQMLAYEDAGGDGWWKGWEMLKAAHAGAKGKTEPADAR
jgi:hypothetical protein